MGLVLGILFGLGLLLAGSAITHPKPLRGLQLTFSRRSPSVSPEVWPDVVDELLSAVRAGLPLARAFQMLSQHGPESLRGVCAQSFANYEQTGDFTACIRHFQNQVADSSADKLCSALIVAHEVGGADFGAVLTTLGDALRADARIRHEIAGKQSWTINGAKLAVAAPWLTVLVLSSRPTSASAYTSASGVRLLMFCAVISIIAYRLMLRLARLPETSRLMA